MEPHLSDHAAVIAIMGKCHQQHQIHPRARPLVLNPENIHALKTSLREVEWRKWENEHASSANGALEALQGTLEAAARRHCAPGASKPKQTDP